MRTHSTSQGVSSHGERGYRSRRSRALAIAIAARDAFQFLGPPEGELALAEAVVYLASAPNRTACTSPGREARQSARDTPAAPVPLHIRNAPPG